MFNGTATLHTALVALGIGPDDEVVVPTLTYIGIQCGVVSRRRAKKLHISLFDFVHLILYLIKSLKKNLFQKNDNRDGYWAYIRSVDHFIRVFKENRFKKDSEYSIINRNGSFHYFRFEAE